MILLLDNYDSFTYNLYQYLAELGAEVQVHRNDAVSVADIARLAPERIVISPGPCTPKEAGIATEVIREFGPRIPVLGVCLGHQCIGYTYGGNVIRAGELMHGKTSLIYHEGQGVLVGLSNPFEAIRYHSLIIERESLPACLEVTAQTATGLIMGVRHRDYPVEGIQFHPESVMTRDGKAILRNFLESGSTRLAQQASVGGGSTSARYGELLPAIPRVESARS